MLNFQGLPELRSDVMDFLTQLTGLGMITEDLHPISKEPSGEGKTTMLNICTRVYAIRDKRCEVLDDVEIEKMMKEFLKKAQSPGVGSVPFGMFTVFR